MLLRTQTVLAGCLLLASGCALLGFEVIAGSGVATSETRDGESFHAIRVGGALNVEVLPGEACSVTISGDDNLVPLINSVTENGELRLYTESGVSMRPKTPLRITIICPDVDSIDVSGASDVKAESIVGESVRISASGASSVEASGSCNILKVEASGASNLHLAALTANSVDVRVSGASDARVHATESITGSASGASDVVYSGTDNVSVSTSGASDATKAG